MIVAWVSGGSVADGALHVMSLLSAMSSAVMMGEGGYEEGGEW